MIKLGRTIIIHRVSLIFIIICIFHFSNKQLKAQSTANYVFSTTTTASLEDMSSGTTSMFIPLTDDRSSGVIDIGFEFVYMGAVYSQFSANSNGQIRLGNTAISGTNVSTFSANTPVIAPISGDNKLLASTGKVHYKVTGVAPNRVLIVEWKDITISITTGTGSLFQALLYETTGEIEFRYGVMYNTKVSAVTLSAFHGSSNIANTVGWLATITGTPTYTTSTATITNTSFGAASNMTNLNSSSDGSRRSFVFLPPSTTPSAPTGMNFSAISTTGMTVNWSDASSNETGFCILKSTDGVLYSIVANVAANTTSYVASGLNYGTTYYWKVYATTEGRASTALTGSQSSTLGTMSGSYTVGSGKTYANIAAAFTAITTNGLSGNVNLVLYTSESVATTYAPPAANVLGNYTITIYPVSTGLSLVSSNTTGAFNFDGRKNIIIDGRVNATGSTKDLVLSCSGAGGYALQFINEASNISINYCKINSVDATAAEGTLLFSTTTTLNGNNNITISNCDVYDGATVPTNAIYGLGTEGLENYNITIQNNNIYNFKTYGVYLKNARSWLIDGNSFYTTLGTPPSATQNSIYMHGGYSHTISNNYIGGHSASCGGAAWVNSANSNFYGIYLATWQTYTNEYSTTTHLVENNIIQNISLTGALAATVFWGIYISDPLNANILNNTIGHASNANSIMIASTTSGSRGINSASNDGAGNILIQGNLIANVKLVNSGGSSGFRAIEIFTGDVKKNKIYRIDGQTLTYACSIYGISLQTSRIISNEVSNNMISLDGGTIDHSITGITSNIQTGATANIYNNSVLIYGTIGASAPNTNSCFYRELASYANCYNNIFINNRTGTANNYAVRSHASSPERYISDYNFLASSALSQIGNNGSALTIAAWKAIDPARDPNSWSVISAASSSISQVNPSDLFTSHATGDLSIKSSSATVDWFIAGKGIAGATSGSLAGDYAASTGRSTTLGIATDIGADEFSTESFGSTCAPHTITIAGGWSQNTPQTFAFGGRNVATLTFTSATGSNPSSVDLIYYSGDNPPLDNNNEPSVAKAHSNAWWQISPTGGSGYTYNLTLNYDNSILGTISAETDITIGKWAAPYPSNNWVSSMTSTVDATANTVSITGQTSFSKFTLVDSDTPLPIELLSFNASCTEYSSELIWQTASELNNNYFTVERSYDMQNWTFVGNINSKGNSSSIQSYQLSDNTVNLNAKSIFYRLSQTDFDGKFEVFPPIALNCFDVEEFEIISVAKEGSNIAITYKGIIDENMSVEMYSMSGQKIYSKNTISKKGINKYYLNDLNLAPGMYVFMFETMDKLLTKKIVLK
ncbi:MAG: fibronectin type III domain-containing protein [Bacteroidota bacterium]